MPHPQPHRRGALAAAVFVLAILALLPARWGRWTGQLGRIASMLTAPVSSPAYSLVRLVKPEPAGVSEEVAAIRNESDKWKQLYQQVLVENERLRKRFDELSRNFLPAEAQVRTLLRSVIGSSGEPGGQIKIRLERNDPVEVNNVATTIGVQLIGRVIEVAPRLCWVRLINDRAAGQIEGVLMAADADPRAQPGSAPDPANARGPRCLLRPVTSGLLQGYVNVGSTEQVPAIGHIVRLQDQSWPASAQALVIGAVERVEPSTTGHYIITVKPTVELDRLAEVYLRIAEQDDRPSAGRATDGGAP